MEFKTDWSEARLKLEAMWDGKATGRPCMAVTARQVGGATPPPPPLKEEGRWLDPDWVIADLRARISGVWWGGEAIPSYLLMAGWVVSAGGKPRFGHDTIWFNTFAVDFKKPSPFVVTEDDPWIQKHRNLYLAAARESAGSFLLGHPVILPANDLLSMHMGTECFLMALTDEPKWMRAAILRGTHDLDKERRRLQEKAKPWTPFWYGNAGWMPFWAPKPFASTQSDVSCMLSPEMFEQFVVPELDYLGNAYGGMWYHLDGHDARQHLPRLLSLPYLRVIQYTPTPTEPPNGVEHLGFYRQIQKAGRMVHISLPPRNVEALVGKLDPGLLMLDIWCESVADGLALLELAERW